VRLTASTKVLYLLLAAHYAPFSAVRRKSHYVKQGGPRKMFARSPGVGDFFFLYQLYKDNDKVKILVRWQIDKT